MTDEEAKMVSGFEAFEARHCETAATGSLLRQIGLELSEPMILGLGQGFGFIYWKMSFMKLPFIGGRAKPFELTRTFCRNLGLGLDERETLSKRKAWENVSSFVESGVLVGLQLDCYHLEHFNHSFHFAGHFLSVYGFDSNDVYVFDTGKEYRVSRANLEKARFEKGSMAAKARSYTISGGCPASAIPAAIPNALREIATEFLNPPIKNFGYLGIQKLSKEMPKWLETAPDPSSDLNAQAELMESGGTGGAIFRSFFKDFLRECLEHVSGNPNIREAANRYEQAAENWTEIASLIKSAGDTGEQAHLDKASGVCAQTADLEKAAMELLCEV